MLKMAALPKKVPLSKKKDPSTMLWGAALVSVCQPVC